MKLLRYGAQGQEKPGLLDHEGAIVTRDEVSDPQNLRLWLEVDDKRVHDGST